MGVVLLALEPATMLVVAVVAVVVLGVVYFAIRFWLVSTRPPDIQDIKTPALDRINEQALRHLEESEADTQEEEAPEELRHIVPPEDSEPADGYGR